LENTEKEKDKFEKKAKIILKKNLGKRDLTQLFTTFVTPDLGRTIQTPEFRSSLSKTIRFRRNITNPGTKFGIAYDGAEHKAFTDARQYYISLGWKAKKIISDSDCNALWHTIEAEADRKDEDSYISTQKAIAWVILNRYNSNREYWGGNDSLENICKHAGTDGFKYWKNLPLNPETLDKHTLNSFHNNLISIYEYQSDPSKGATNFYTNKVEDINSGALEFTDTIGGYHFYKRLSESVERPIEQIIASSQPLEQPSVSSQPLEQQGVSSQQTVANSAKRRKLDFLSLSTDLQD